MNLKQGRELDLARLALHVVEASRAARRLGLKIPGFPPPAFHMLDLAAQFRTLSADLDDVPNLKLTESTEPGRLGVFELYEVVLNELVR